MWFIGAVLGVVAGAAGGYLASLFELRLRRAANRARRWRGEPVARNEVAPPFWLPGALAGAAAAAVSFNRVGWLGAAPLAFSLPIVAWLLPQVLTLVLDLIRRGCNLGHELVATVSAWRDFLRAEWGPGMIANADLSPQDVPAPEADWGTISSFALTFDGFDHWGSFVACAELANSAMVAYVEQRVLPDSLSDLRTCLFFEQRRHRHMGRVPVDLDIEYVRALVEAIRECVLAAERSQH